VGLAMANFHANLGSGDALLKLKKKGDDAILEVYMGLVDIGTGAKSAMAIIGADEVGVSLENTRVIWGDTETCPTSSGEGGSRATTVVGTAVRAAARRMNQRILSFASNYFRAPVDELYIRNGKVSKKNRTKFAQSANVAVSLGRMLQLMGQVELEEREVKPLPVENLPPRYAFAAHFCEVQIDRESGQVNVVGYTAAHESGEIINRLTAENQVKGSIVMGIGMALSESVLIDKSYGNMQNPSFMNYRLPGHTMIPKIDVEFVDDKLDTLGPKSLGEIPLLPVPAAIGNAIFNATGVRLRDTPFLSETLLRSLGDSKAVLQTNMQ
jgi:CO/xanthine dehydrogenase Mo-binding subunit